MEQKTIRIIRSNRKTLLIGIDESCQVYVRAPLRCPDGEISAFVKSQSAWVEKHLRKMAERQSMEQKNARPKLSTQEIQALTEKARLYIPERVRFYAAKVGVTYGRITIRSQTSRWGSCSAKGNLNFNCLLMLMPAEMIDYTIVHELCHRIEMNHSARFYALLSSILPDHKAREKWMKENGRAIIQQIRQ